MTTEVFFCVLTWTEEDFENEKNIIGKSGWQKLPGIKTGELETGIGEKTGTLVLLGLC